MVVPNPIVIPMTVESDIVAFNMSVSSDVIAFAMSVGAAIYTSPVSDYEGPYSVIPTRSQQVLHTNNKRAISDIIVEPIPRNYGLVEYDGSHLTIS